MPHDWLCCVAEWHLHFLSSGSLPRCGLGRSDDVFNPQNLSAVFVAALPQLVDGFVTDIVLCDLRVMGRLDIKVKPELNLDEETSWLIKKGPEITLFQSLLRQNLCRTEV